MVNYQNTREKTSEYTSSGNLVVKISKRLRHGCDYPMKSHDLYQGQTAEYWHSLLYRVTTAPLASSGSSKSTRKEDGDCTDTLTHFGGSGASVKQTHRMGDGKKQTLRST